MVIFPLWKFWTYSRRGLAAAVLWNVCMILRILVRMCQPSWDGSFVRKRLYGTMRIIRICEHQEDANVSFRLINLRLFLSSGV